MEEQLERIKIWLGRGSINIFGLPMSGKDTVGKRLAEDLTAKFLSSGDIIRKVETEQQSSMTDKGELIPTNKFYDIVLPYFGREDLAAQPLVLSSIGRWEGEENEVMKAAKEGGHQIKIVVELELDEEVARARWQAAKSLADRGERADDLKPEVFETRIREYYEKTAPVLRHYNELGILVKVDGAQSREKVYQEVVKKVAKFVG